MTPEHRANISAACKGRVFTEQHKAKLREAARNRKRSPEHLAAMQAGLVRWWETPDGREARRILGEERRVAARRQLEIEAAKYKISVEEYRRLSHLYWSNHKRRKRHAGESKVDYIIRRVNEAAARKKKNGIT